jgi:hypothetical protein
MASRFPDQRAFFASWQNARDIKALSALLVSACLFSFIIIFCARSFFSPLTDADTLRVDVANEHPYMHELNVLVVGMPNVGKSTLLNALRRVGIEGREWPPSLSACTAAKLFSDRDITATSKAFRTSAQPGMTRTLSNRLKLSQDPLLYAFDTPGVMLPYLGSGTRGAERGVKLALIGRKCSIAPQRLEIYTAG